MRINPEAIAPSALANLVAPKPAEAPKEAPEQAFVQPSAEPQLSAMAQMLAMGASKGGQGPTDVDAAAAAAHEVANQITGGAALGIHGGLTPEMVLALLS